MIKVGKNFLEEDIPKNYYDCMITVPPVSSKIDFFSNKDRKIKKKRITTKYRKISDKVWKKCFDALKPGANVFIFVNRRYIHRWACQLEDIGFEIRDTAVWIRKELNNFKIKEDTTLNSAWEPILMLRKPFESTNMIEHHKKWRTGKLNLREAKIGVTEPIDEENFKYVYRKPSNVVRTEIARDNLDIILYYQGNNFINYDAKFYKKNKKYLRKKEAVLEYFVRVGTFKGQKILDPFAGYGGLEIVCSYTNRKYEGFEINKNFIEIYKNLGLNYVESE